MQKFRPGSISKVCLTLLSLSLLTQTVFGYESYAYNKSSHLLNSNSLEAHPIETTLKLDSTTPITNSSARVNLSLRDSDLRQALRMLADKAKMNIVFDASVEGKITLDLNNIKLNDAFMVIFKSSQLMYSVDNNTIMVAALGASKELAYTRSNMTVLPIKYVNAESVAEFLNENLFKSNIFGLSNQAVVTSNPRTNQIVIFGTMADVNAIKRVLPVLDTKPMVNSFKVNHTTPKEMANLICDSMFYNEDSENGTSSNSTSANTDSSTSTDEDGASEVILGGGVVACRDIASDEENTSSSSSSSTSSSRRSSNGSSEYGIEEAKLVPFKANPLTVVYFPELGKISTFGGSVEQVEVIKDFIKEHDKKQLMAYVELSVIELTESGSKEFNNTWNLWTPFINLGFDSENGLTTSSNSPFFIFGHEAEVSNQSGSADESSIKTVTKSNNKALVYQLKYLINNGNGRVLTNPKIMVTNGKKAVIDMTSDYVKSVTSQILSNATGLSAGTQRTYEIGSDEGLLIEIVPFISPDGYVSLNISPEFATIKEREYALGQSGERELAATLLQRRDLELKNIRIKDGETLVLAGLIKENETQKTQKMPILSDLPFIGTFFRSNNSERTREELVIVVTPHIVKDGEDGVDNKIYDL